MPRQKSKPNIVLVLVVMVGLLILLKTGLLFKITGWITKPLVNRNFEIMNDEIARQQNQPRIVITTAGEQIDCKRVLDQGKSWGLICKNGKIMSMKKEGVREIQIPPDPAK